MSIDGQIDEIKKMAQRNDYQIVDILIEQKSAKKPGRPVFDQMIERLKNGEADGILCWKLNRLARNPVDAGTISWLLQGNVIKAIHSCERSYYPTDNVLMMQIDFGIANQFIKDLSSDVKRGMRNKAQDGWNPASTLPIGYIHNGDKKNTSEQIIEDPKRFAIVKTLWKKMATGAYSFTEIRNHAERLGLRNRNGKPYEIKAFQRMFANPMYYGKFFWNDDSSKLKLWSGKHKAMISEHTFRKVQSMIADRSKKTRPRSHVYTYRGLITCGGCSGHVGAERKLQVICTNCKHKYSIITNQVCRKCGKDFSEMKNPSIVDKIYYRCLKNTDPNCKQPSITENEIEAQFEALLEEISIPNEVYTWGQKHLNQHVQSVYSDNHVLIDSLRKNKDIIQKKLLRLIDLKVSGDVKPGEANILKKQYEESLTEIEQQIFTQENATSITKQEANEYLKFSKNCADRFKKGNQSTKKEIISFFATNLTLMGKSLYFSTKKAPEVLNSVQSMLTPQIGKTNLK